MSNRVAHQVFLPKEHGSWSLALEPIIFGLLLVPSMAGVALALCATSAFFLRRPLKSFWQHHDRPSALVLLILVFCILIGLAELIVMGETIALWPLIPTLPLGLLYLHWDGQNESRAAAAELTGISLFALLPATMATLAGHSAPFAIALTALMLARSVPAVLTVRCWLRRRKNQCAPVAPALLTTLGALIMVAAFTHYDYIPVIAVGLITFSCFRLLLLSPMSPDWPARRVGAIEAIFGVIYITTLAIAYHFPA